MRLRALITSFDRHENRAACPAGTYQGTADHASCQSRSWPGPAARPVFELSSKLTSAIRTRCGLLCCPQRAASTRTAWAAPRRARRVWLVASVQAVRAAVHARPATLARPAAAPRRRAQSVPQAARPRPARPCARALPATSATAASRARTPASVRTPAHIRTNDRAVSPSERAHAHELRMHGYVACIMYLVCPSNTYSEYTSGSSNCINCTAGTSTGGASGASQSSACQGMQNSFRRTDPSHSWALLIAPVLSPLALAACPAGSYRGFYDDSCSRTSRTE